MYGHTEQRYLISLVNPLNQARFLAIVRNTVACLTLSDVNTQCVFERMAQMAQAIECVRSSEAKCEGFDGFSYLEFQLLFFITQSRLFSG